MTTVTPVYTNLSDDRKTYTVAWSNLALGDVGDWIPLPDHADRSVQVEGTLGSGGKCRIEGSNDTQNGRVLHDPSGIPLDVVANGIYAVLEAVRQIRPNVTGGDGSTAVTVTMFFRRA